MQLLELMGSQLQVESAYGQGTKFSFQLEQKIMDPEPIGNLEERIRQQATGYAYNVTFTAPQAQILVVDDNAVNRKVFVNLLKETKVQIDEASGGQECLDKISQKAYDIIFLDHMMPEMDGIETLHHMKEEPNHMCCDTPVIALTANAIAGAKEMYLSEGFDGFVSKPINPEKLEKLLVERLPENKVVYEKKEVTEPQKEPVKIELPDVDGVDWEYALLHTKDIQVLKDTVKDYYHLIDMEAEELEGFFRQIEKAEDTENQQTKEIIRQYRVKVHSMKSSAAMIGALSLSGVARMLEYAARDERRDVIINVTPAFLEQWRSYKELLKVCIEEERSETEKAEADFKMLGEFLNLLESAMEDMDIDTADEIIKQIIKFQYPEQILVNIEKLAVAVTNIDSEQVTECVEKLKIQIQQMEG